MLIVPNRADVDRVERQLLGAASALLGGSIGTFDDVFERVAFGSGAFAGRCDAWSARFSCAGWCAADLHGYSAFRGARGVRRGARADARRARGGLARSRGDRRRARGAVRRLSRRARPPRALGPRPAPQSLRRAAPADLDAWHGEPVFAYGFEDLTGAEWALLEALAARTEVTVSLPYEPGRPAFAALRRTAEDLAGLAEGASRSSPALRRRRAAGARASGTGALRGPAAGGAAAGRCSPFLRRRRQSRHARARRRRGARPVARRHVARAIGIVVPGYDRIRGALETVLGSFGIPYAIDGELRLTQTPLVHALAALLRFAWAGGTRNDLFRFLRSPFSGLERRSVDFVEGRLRGRAVQAPERVVEEAERMRDGAALPALAELREPPIRSRRCASSRSGCCATRTASSGRRRMPRAASTSGPMRRCGGCWPSSRAGTS